MRIGIVVDSACDLPREFLDQHGVLIMPITLRIGDALIEDRRHPEETQAFYARHLDRKSEDFAESIPYSVAQIERLFLERLVLDYDYVFCLTITSTRSPIFDHAMQASRTSDFIFSVGELIEYISKLCTLYPGDLIFTGTPEGVGPLVTGDVVEASIAGLETLRFVVR